MHLKTQSFALVLRHLSLTLALKRLLFLLFFGLGELLDTVQNAFAKVT